MLKSGLLSGRTEARLCAAVRKASIRLCDRGAGERREYQVFDVVSFDINDAFIRLFGRYVRTLFPILRRFYESFIQEIIDRRNARLYAHYGSAGARSAALFSASGNRAERRSIQESRICQIGRNTKDCAGFDKRCSGHCSGY